MPYHPGPDRARRPTAPPRRRLLETVREALAENRVDLYLQPVVSLPQRRTVFYESFSRLRDATGRVMMPAEYLAVAEPEGLVTAIDNLLLFRCVQIVRRLAKKDRKVGIFCNISLASLARRGLLPAVPGPPGARTRTCSGALIFELGQAAFEQPRRGRGPQHGQAGRPRLPLLASTRSPTSTSTSQDLARADVKFLKVGAQMLLDRAGRGRRATGRCARCPTCAAEDFAALTRRYGVEVIAEKIEAERQVVDVLELDIAYGQGHLFGEPRAIKDAVLAEAAPPIAFMQDALRRRAAEGGWRWPRLTADRTAGLLSPWPARPGAARLCAAR